MWVGGITPSQYFFSVEMPAKYRETKKFRENLIPLPTQLFSERRAHVPQCLFPPENVSLTCQDRVQESLDHQADSRGGLAQRLLPGLDSLPR